MQSLPGTDGRRRIYLMRHGNVDYITATLQGIHVDDVPLTEQGREEARASGAALAHVPFDRAVCSGLARAVETATIVLGEQADSAPPTLDHDLAFREIKGGGKIRTEIKSRRDLLKILSERFDRAAEPGARMGADGEVFADALARSVGAIEALLNEPDWHTALLVAHEGINRIILGWATGADLKAVGAFEQDTAGINVLDFDCETAPDGFVLRRKIIKAVNLTPYNYLKHGMNLTSLEAILKID